MRTPVALVTRTVAPGAKNPLNGAALLPPIALADMINVHVEMSNTPRSTNIYGEKEQKYSTQALLTASHWTAPLLRPQGGLPNNRCTFAALELFPH